MLKMVDGTGIIGVDMVCPLGGTVSPPQPPNYDKVEVEGGGSLVLANSLKAPLERVELLGGTEQLTTTGKNLFDAKQLQGVPGFEVEGDEITQSGYNTSADKTLKQLCPTITPGTYILSASNGDFTGLFGLSKPMYKKRAVEVTEDDLNKTVALVGSLNKAIKYKLQIEKGSTTTPYEPYTGLKPSPSPEYPQEIKSAGKWNDGTQKYEVDVKVTGKNLLDIKDITSETPQWTEIPCLIKNNIYIKSNNSTALVENNQARLIVYFKDGTSRAMYDNLMACGLPFKVEFENPITTIKVRGTHIKSGVYSDIQVEYGNEPTPYEPYTEQSVQIALDEPLRGIGEYKDTITKDGVVRKIAPYEVNLSDLRDGGYEKTNTVMFSVKVQNKTVGYASLKPTILCNILPDCALQMSNIYNNDKECIAVGNMYVLFRVNKSRLKDISSFEAIKQSFIELMEGKKMLVEYALETPVTEPLPESVQAQLSSLHSENGVTHVFVDSGEVPCGIKLTYRKEK